MPTPKKYESKQDFISRCIPYVKKEHKDYIYQYSNAVCYNIWMRHKQENEDMSKKERILLHLNTELEGHVNLAKDDEFVIDRCTMLVGNGTYNGVFFPAEELEKSFFTFEGRPINLNHSSENVEDIVGYVVDTEFDEGRLTCRPVFDEETAKYNEAMGYIKSRFHAGDIPNVSVGIWLDRMLEEDEETGKERYVARNIDGDHLALVVHGACNPGDGCGIGLSSDKTITTPNDTLTITHDEYVEDVDIYKDLEIELMKEKIKEQKIFLEE